MVLPTGAALLPSQRSVTFEARLKTFSSVECIVECGVAGILFAINE
jgi:hypothetical protein